MKTIEDATFTAATRLTILNHVSREWFDGSEVVDWVTDNNNRLTLLSNANSGNVIGVIYVHEWDNDAI